MTGVSGRTTLVHKTVYFAKGSTKFASNATFADVVGSGKVVDTGNLLPKMIDLGDFEQQANSSSQQIYGQTEAETIVEAPTWQDFSVAIENDHTNSIQDTFRGLRTGDDVQVVVNIQKGAGQTVYAMNCSVASYGVANAPGGADGWRVGFSPSSLLVLDKP